MIIWNTFKHFINQNKSNILFIDKINHYQIWTIFNNIKYETIIKKTSPVNNDQLDFETNYKSLSSTNNLLDNSIELAYKYLTLDINGFSFIAAPDTTTIYDFELTQKYIFKGISYISSNINIGDYIKIELIDKNNVLNLGVDYIVKTPITKAYIQSTVNSGPIKNENLSPPELPASGLFLRVHYTNTSQNNVDMYVNPILYLKVQN